MSVARGALLASIVVLAACAADPSSATGTMDDEINAGLKPDGAEVKVLLADVDFDPGTLGADKEKRDVTFYDTASLANWKKGVLLRSRRVKGDGDDVTVKLRPMIPAKVDHSFLNDDGFKCELDVNAGSEGTSSCSLTLSADGGDIADANESQSKIDDLWNGDAKRFARQVIPDLDFHGLRTFGPIASTVWKLDVHELGTTVTFERWEVPGGDVTLEASVKVKTKKVPEYETSLVRWLEAQHLRRATTQKTKTAAALEALSKG